MITAGQMWGAVVSAVVTLAGLLLTMHAQNRRDAAKDRKAQMERDLRWDIILQEYPIHGHFEGSAETKTTPLTVGGIQYPKGS